MTTEFNQALEKLSLTNSVEIIMESLHFLHDYFQSGKGDVSEVTLDTDILTYLSNLITGYSDNVVKTEALSLLTVLSFRNSWSEPFAVDTSMSLMSNMLDSRNLPLSAKVIEIAQQVLETNNVASQSLTSLATLIYSLTQLLQNKESDEKTKESLLKSLLLILDKYKVEDPKAKKKEEKEKAKGKKDKEKEKGTLSAASSSSSSITTPPKNIAPPFPVVLSELVALASKLTVEGGVFIRAHAVFVLQILKDKFKVKVPSLKKKGKRAEEEEGSSEDGKEDDEEEDGDGETLPKFSAVSHGASLVLSENNRCVTSTSPFQSAFIALKVKEGIHKITFAATTTYSSHVVMLGAVSAASRAQAVNTYLGVVQGRAALYTINSQLYAYVPSSTAQTTVTGSNSKVSGGAGVTMTITMEYNADRHTIAFQYKGKPSFLIRKVSKDAELAVSVQYGSITIKKYEELDEPSFADNEYTVM